MEKTLQQRLKQAQVICKEHGAALTALRIDVLRLIYESTVPLGAYDLLRKLRITKPNAEPPTVYRTLEFLQKYHLIHRIESDNAYIACDQPNVQHQGHFLLCQQCGLAIELQDERIKTAIEMCAAENKFTIANHCTEIIGLCENCCVK